MREKTAILFGAAVRYWVTGVDRETGPDGSRTLILLHGLGSDHSGLSELAGRVTGVSVAVPDLPGFGRSAPLPQVHSLTGYADFVEVLRRHLGADRVDVAGHSLGASIALVHAARYPDRVRRLVLFNPVTEASGVSGWLGRSYYDIGAWLPSPLDRAWLASRPAIWAADQFVLRTRDTAIRRAILDQDYVAYRQADLRAVKESFRSYYGTDFHGLARRVTAPTLLVTGGRDGLAPPAAVRRLADRISGARLLVLDRAGHLFPAEQPAAAGRLLNGFLIDRRSPVDNARTAL
jgi:pimeloyl-ACP methyl ester carboxylesterase